MSAPGMNTVACPKCGKVFKTRGLASHRRKCDNVNLNEEIVIEKVKARWTEEETYFLAKAEAEALLQGVKPLGINNVLFKKFCGKGRGGKGRTTESVKGQRRKAEYKALVRNFVKEGQKSPKNKQAIKGRQARREQRESPTPQTGGSKPEERRDNAESNTGIALETEHVPPPEDLDADACSSSATEDSELFLGKTKLAEWLEEHCNSGGTAEEKSLNQVIRTALRGEPFAVDLDRVLSRYEHPAENGRQPAPEEHLSKRNARKKEYRIVQNLYNKNRKVCAQRVLDGVKEDQVAPDELVNYWFRVMSETPTDEPCPSEDLLDARDVTVLPITEQEVQENMPKHSSAPGPDGLTVKEFKAIPRTFVVKLYNLFLYWGRASMKLGNARTIFIPKVEAASQPGEYRPISIGSVLLRTFHKILDKRLRQIVHLRDEQRAFKSTDGCFENIMILSTLLKTSHAAGRSLYMANIDLSKAFDSATHTAILNGLARHQMVGKSMIDYLHWFYTNSTTTLQHRGVERTVRPGKGVRQGDPLSPLLFNAVIDEFIDSIPPGFGVRLGEGRCASLAFADDLVILAETAAGLQFLLDKFQEFLSTRGLTVNVKKSSNLSLVGDGKNKKAKICPVAFKVNGEPLRVIDCSGSWRYLGVEVNTSGEIWYNGVNFDDLIVRLERAPLKPQQKMNILIFYLIPRLIYGLVMSAKSKTYLHQIDRRIRAAVRLFLHLPKDVPVAFLYAAVGDGGLEVTCLATMIPRIRRSRLLGVQGAGDGMLEGLVTMTAWKDEVERAGKGVKFKGVTIESRTQERSYWKDQLLQMVDTRGLREARTCAAAAFIRNPPHFLNGREYVDLIKLRAQALPSKTRCARGRAKDTRCRAGCAFPETHAHIIQVCPRSYAPRLERHNCVASWIAEKMRNDGCTVSEEPRIKVKDEIRYPDLICVKGERAWILNVQIVGEYKSLNSPNEDKIRKYSAPDFVDAVRSEFSVTTVAVHAITATERGLVCPRSAEALGLLGFSKRDISSLILKVVRGSLRCFYHFMRGTNRSV